jgi:hypothetical protein
MVVVEVVVVVVAVVVARSWWWWWMQLWMRLWGVNRIERGNSFGLIWVTWPDLWVLDAIYCHLKYGLMA